MSASDDLLFVVPPKKTPLFSTKERKLLCRLINEKDPNQAVIKSQAKTTAAREKKMDLWADIANSFNVASSREGNVTVSQLKGLMQRIRRVAKKSVGLQLYTSTTTRKKVRQ